ncbi:hypothetical protein ABZ707_01940 [Streptomyces sp. NPDC006923]|uniref:hypothetical protein n=1 Tax=Streptomyces sp. NPDC006923 TaxID=3155355 RepID=UPI0033E0A8F8
MASAHTGKMPSQAFRPELRRRSRLRAAATTTALPLDLAHRTAGDPALHGRAGHLPVIAERSAVHTG